MLRIIAGLELPDVGGKVLFDGKDMTSVPIEKRNVGMVFQSFNLYPHMTALGNVTRQKTCPGEAPRVNALSKDERSADRGHDG